jgi:endoglycosylceramidase
VALVLSLALGASGAAAADAHVHRSASMHALRPDGRWLKDGYGRIVIIHGLQVAHKTAPYYPPPQAFTDADGQNLENWGFNAVRLAWFWVGLEPRRGQFDAGYVDQLVRDGQILNSHDVYTLLEAHQDLYGPALGGDGFPAWATITDGVPVPPHTAADPEGARRGQGLRQPLRQHQWDRRRVRPRLGADGRRVSQQPAAARL